MLCILTDILGDSDLILSCTPVKRIDGVVSPPAINSGIPPAQLPYFTFRELLFRFYLTSILPTMVAGLGCSALGFRAPADVVVWDRGLGIFWIPICMLFWLALFISDF